MSSKSKVPLPPNWQDFEDLCWGLWKEIWKDNLAQKNGRSGNAQSGVDIWGRPSDGRGYAGIQCKDKDQLTHKQLTVKEVRDEIRKAKSFIPPLVSYTIATTAPRSSTLQKQVRNISDANEKSGSFRVTVVSWDDIEELLFLHRPLIASYHYPLIFGEELLTAIRSTCAALGASRYIQKPVLVNNELIKHGDFAGGLTPRKPQEGIFPTCVNTLSVSKIYAFEKTGEFRDLLDAFLIHQQRSSYNLGESISRQHDHNQEYVAGQAAEEILALISRWDFEKALLLAESMQAVSSNLAHIPYGTVVKLELAMCRAYLCYAEQSNHLRTEVLCRATNLLAHANDILTRNNASSDEYVALLASLRHMKDGADAALESLNDASSKYAVRTKLGILLGQQKYQDGIALVSGLPPDEYWMDLAICCYILDENIEKANELLKWQANQPTRVRYLHSCVRFGLSTLQHINSKVAPLGCCEAKSLALSQAANAIATAVADCAVRKILETTLELAAVQVMFELNRLLGNAQTAVVALNLMETWTPVPLDFARGVLAGFRRAPVELPERLRTEHPASLNALILAAAVEAVCFGAHTVAYGKAKELFTQVSSNDERESLFALFFTLWQNLEGKESKDCENAAKLLISHNDQLQTMFLATKALREHEPDTALSLLGENSTSHDVVWTQALSGAYLQKGDYERALEKLLPVARSTVNPEIYAQTANAAMRAQRFEDAAWCYGKLLELNPNDIDAHKALAGIYTHHLNNLPKAVAHYKVLHTVEPLEPAYGINLAKVLCQDFEPQKGLSVIVELCQRSDAPLEAVLFRAQILQSLGRNEEALSSLRAYKQRFWAEPYFLLNYMNIAFSAGADDEANLALAAMHALQRAGTISSELFRAVQMDEVVEMMTQSFQETRSRHEHFHGDMLQGKAPWIWPETAFGNPVYMGWRIRTQELEWIQDEDANRARFCIYSTNSIHPGTADGRKRELLPLKCPPPGSPVVADISALITLHRLSLLELAADYFGEILVPASYLATVLPDSRRMVLGQRSRFANATQITQFVADGRISVMATSTETGQDMPVVDEHSDKAGHRYTLTDILRPLYHDGLISDADLDRVSRVCAKPSAVNLEHPALTKCQRLLVDLTTLETIASAGLLDAASKFFQLHITEAAREECQGRLRSIGHQQETRQWHMDLWTRLKNDPRFKFVPHSVPEALREHAKADDVQLPFLSCFVAKEKGLPLLADDRVCQVYVLNLPGETPRHAFGSDVFLYQMLDAAKLQPDMVADSLRQLMSWRYRFVQITAQHLKILADRHKGNLPGKPLREVAAYIHDCMRDHGLFNGQENTEMGESMAARIYLSWMSAVTEFLVLAWADEKYDAEAATLLTRWACRELLPSVPVVIDTISKVRLAALNYRFVISHALVKTCDYPGEPRMADAMRALKDSLGLSDDTYQQTVTGLLYGTANAQP